MNDSSRAHGTSRLAWPESSKGETLEPFLVELRPAVLNQDVVTAAELCVGYELMPRGSKQENGKIPPWVRDGLCSTAV